MAPTVAYTSPSRRCREPAEALAARLRIPLVLEPLLLELDFGRWEGRGWAELPRSELDRWAADPHRFAPPSGESGAALIDRMTALRAVLVADPRQWLLVSHGGPLRLLVPMLRGEPPDLLAPSPPTGGMRVVRRPISPVAPDQNSTRAFR